MQHKLYFEAEVRALEEGKFEVIASTGQEDRLGDTINPDGWELRNFRKNPVMLWAHDNFAPPIARATRVWIEDKKLKLKGEFAPTPFAQELRVLVEGGFLNAVSVGFIPLFEDEKGMIDIEGKMYRRAEGEEIKSMEEKKLHGGMRFEKQELLEVSWVAVPALASALVTARKSDMELPLLTKAVELQERVLTSEPFKYTKEQAQEVGNKLADILVGEEKVKKSPACRQEGESKADCIKRKIPELIAEGMDQNQAVAVANSMCSKACADKAMPENDKLEDLITNFMTQMGEAIKTLQAVQAQQSFTPVKSKGRADDKKEEEVTPELRLIRMANKAMDKALENLKKDKSANVVEIRYMRIASRIIDMALIKAKAKNEN